MMGYMDDSFQKKWCRWRYKKPPEDKGILLVSDRQTEQYIPWWWECYSKHNSYPVLLMDIGLSKGLVSWCKNKIQVQKLSIPNSFVKMRDELSGRAKNLTHFFTYDEAWNVRIPWFKKPLAALQTPFQKSILMDLDCEVRGSLDPLFEEAKHFKEVGCAIDPHSNLTRYEKYRGCEEGETQYNSGVVLFHHGAKTVCKWAKLSVEENDRFYGDQEVLSSLSLDPESNIYQLDSKYNTFYYLEKPNSSPLIVHWISSHGKKQLLQKIQQEQVHPLFHTTK